MANVQSVLLMLSDPTRRTLLEALREGPLTVGQLAQRVTVTQSAVSQHLRLLKAADLVSEERAGARRIYSLEAATLGELRGYVDSLWGDALGAFARQVNESGTTEEEG